VKIEIVSKNEEYVAASEGKKNEKDK